MVHMVDHHEHDMRHFVRNNFEQPIIVMHYAIIVSAYNNGDLFRLGNRSHRGADVRFEFIDQRVARQIRTGKLAPAQFMLYRQGKV